MGKESLDRSQHVESENIQTNFSLLQTEETTYVQKKKKKDIAVGPQTWCQGETIRHPEN